MAKINEQLAAGKETVRIVCFGDSITGVYYHTGGRRAWCDMLALALMKIYPGAKLEMFNAGISGHDTNQGLRRMEKDVLACKPNLVVVMFGMNDCARTNKAVFAGRLKKIVNRCLETNAAVVLRTPNSVYSEDPKRPSDKLAEFAETTRQVAKEMGVPLADCYRAYEDVRAANPLEWKFLMSETIHPNLNGHKLFAEVVAETISGKRVKLNDVPPYSPALVFTFDRLSAGEPVSVIAPPPYDGIITNVLRKLYPGAVVDMISWPVKGAPLAEIEQWSKGIRKRKPNLVAVAVPAGAEAANEEKYIRSYAWIISWSLDFGTRNRDTFAILPAVTGPVVKAEDLVRAELARRVVLGNDIGYVERAAKDDSKPENVIFNWFKARQEEWKAFRKKTEK